MSNSCYNCYIGTLIDRAVIGGEVVVSVYNRLVDGHDEYVVKVSRLLAADSSDLLLFFSLHDTMRYCDKIVRTHSSSSKHMPNKYMEEGYVFARPAIPSTPV